MKTCKCIKPDLHEVDGYAQCKLCDQWFNHDLWKTHWKQKVDHAVEIQKIGRNDPCPCESGKKFKKCCIPVKRRRWVTKNHQNETIIERGERLEKEKN